MEYRILGRTGIKVSAIGIGGEGFENKSYEDCEAIIDCAILLLSDKQSPFGKALTPVQCLHYCLTRPAVASIMVGVSNTNQILAATTYTTSSNKEKDYSEVLANANGSSFRGHCMYCGHCAPCSKMIDIASVNKYLDLALIQENVPETLRNHYELLEYHAEDCIECGQCMKNCPFDVDIIGKMKQASELFAK